MADVGAAYARALAAGCSVQMPLADRFWGDRYGSVTCPWGHRGSLAAHTHDLSPEEIGAAMRASG